MLSELSLLREHTVWRAPNLVFKKFVKLGMEFFCGFYEVYGASTGLQATFTEYPLKDTRLKKRESLCVCILRKSTFHGVFMGYLWGFRLLLHCFRCELNETYPLKNKPRVTRLKM